MQSVAWCFGDTEIARSIIVFTFLSAPEKNATDPIVGKLKISQIANQKHNELNNILPPLYGDE